MIAAFARDGLIEVKPRQATGRISPARVDLYQPAAAAIA
jgi:hypothetical protein